MSFPIANIFLGVLGGLMLLDPWFLAKAAAPGYGAEILLAWVFWTRVFLPKPSITLFLFGSFLAVSCAAANHNLIASGPLKSAYLYLLCGMLVAFWEKIIGLFKFFRPLGPIK